MSERQLTGLIVIALREAQRRFGTPRTTEDRDLKVAWVRRRVGQLSAMDLPESKPRGGEFARVTGKPIDSGATR